MGTRSLTHIKERGETLLTIYRQHDGYPSGLGKKLADFLGGFIIVNGFSFEHKEGKVANGMGCLAAQLIKHMKDGIGNVYIYPADSSDCGEEYVYTIEHGAGGIKLTIAEFGGPKLFEGAPKDLAAWLLKEAKKGD